MTGATKRFVSVSSSFNEIKSLCSFTGVFVGPDEDVEWTRFHTQEGS